MVRFQMTLFFHFSIFCFVLCGPIQDVAAWFPFGPSDPDMENVYVDSKLKCDTCTVIAYQIKTLFDKAAQKTPSIKLTEPEIREIVESICNKDFKEYEVSSVDSRDRMSGPGLADQKKGENSEITREQWTFNIRDTCSKFSGGIGETKIYEAYYKDPSGLTDFLCRGEGIRNLCTMAAKEDSIYPGGFMYDDFFMPDEL